jgi:hypothetical protein
MNRVFAKRFVLVSVGMLFVSLTSVLSGCSGGETPSSPEQEATSLVASLTALVATYTSTPTATPIPKEKPLVEKLNNILENDNVVDDLTKAVEAHYQVMDMNFIPPDGTVIILQIDAMCICVKSLNCCTPEHTFVMLAHALKAYGNQFIEHVPGTITDVQVNLMNNNKLMGSASVPWQFLKGYIATSGDQVSAYTLGKNVIFLYQP